MFSPENQQIKICLLKSSLEEIGNELIVQRSALPLLDVANEEKYKETIAALHVARALNVDKESLKLKSTILTAKRLQLKKQCEEITNCIKRSQDDHNELNKILYEEDQEIELQIRKYEESLKEKADRFRKSRDYYNEETMKNELEMINQNLLKLETEERKLQSVIKQLKQELASLMPDLPDDILAIVGKDELQQKLGILTDKCAKLREKYDHLLKSQKSLF
ncbi:hyaluronan mediated motility receptor-like [Battus philenor]|uniref:hyaluronan mediated motility receptor-like n=1 Tax=Battus philenor TaxID=42288 RepID=UPI0035CFED3F